ncbi:hypothetical protein G4V39_05710 [Thermosulfuriphilus ammonigenes]|uniref:Uncharacterized protein n=1 Tax=Thermosulfuriphilus ammonigenes TaxID=1936021 RepID=A0A6G7PVT0_9BACT|nr:DUF5752 family protein [Thermosulfuriphilus ammonigenes]MBA2848026.1 hypothetical protein [Thermosulfuriphilus ammonigenes]QIJ71789.1 hypothetical protein G4V39_05710 [Thermosulfuriphilus ammonigenes]
MPNDEVVVDYPFLIKDCALVSISTGEKSHSLAELLDDLRRVHSGCLYHHFWGRLLRPSFEHPEYHNDFAAWAYRALHDQILAERLNIIDPQDYPDLEALRQELIDTIEERMDETEYTPWLKAETPFYFVRSQIVVLDTHRQLTSPEELPEAVLGMSSGSIFYHFIDARRRTSEGTDDFRAWMTAFGPEYQDLIRQLAAIDPYFVTLTELRQQLYEVFRDFFSGRSL